MRTMVAVPDWDDNTANWARRQERAAAHNIGVLYQRAEYAEQDGNLRMAELWLDRAIRAADRLDHYRRLAESREELAKSKGSGEVSAM